MRVLQVIEPLEGGVGTHVLDLGAGLLERGHDVEIALPRSASRAADFETLGVPLHDVPLVPEIAAAADNFRAFRGLLSVMRQGRFDVVHVQDLKAGALGRPAARLAKVPAIVYTPHGFAHRTQHMRGRSGTRLRRALTFGVERSLTPITDRIVAVCEDELLAAVADGVAPADRFTVVPYGVADGSGADPDPELSAFAAGEPLVGFMTRLVTRKGVDILLDALVLLRDRGALPRTALVGNGDRRDDLVARITEEGLGDRVTVRPFSTPVWPKLAAFDVFVLPTLWDVFPIAVLEAMAAGVPVVASDVNGLPESVDDGVTGMLVESGRAEPLADAIARQVADVGLRSRMGAAGRAAYERRFQPPRMVDAIEGVYRELLRAASVPSAR